MKVLGIHTGHCATACLLVDGKIEAMASEERFTRKKNQSGFPTQTIRWIATQHALDGPCLDAVVLSERLSQIRELDWHGTSWEGVVSRLSSIVPSAVLTSNALVAPYVSFRSRFNRVIPKVAGLLAEFEIPVEKISCVEHHTCHAHAAYWLDPRRQPDQDTLVVTLDNTGDGLCGTVNVASRDRFERLAEFQSLRSVGMLYTAVTRLLGLKPVEHEYKVMGMAPYARPERADAVYQRLRRCIDLTDDGLTFINRRGLGETAYVRALRKELAEFRFDDIAGGAQRLVEELVLTFLKSWAQITGIRKLALGGGVFMNVKLNMLINESGKFDEPFFLPACGDEHNAAGAALYSARELTRARGELFDPCPLDTLYLGDSFGSDDARSALLAEDGSLQWKHVTNVDEVTAEALAAGLVVGRYRGRMEFGARSLGNRSILARADNLKIVHTINHAIKMRDFWMPFAPTILWERRKDYVACEGETPAPHMILGFHATDRAADELIAGLHPFDHTCRPQLLRREANPRYYDMLKRFEALTGIGGVLNTSFNLHGEPVVRTPADAIRAYRLSDLDLLMLEDYVVWDPGRVGTRFDAEPGQTLAAVARANSGDSPFFRIRRHATRTEMPERVDDPTRSRA